MAGGKSVGTNHTGDCDSAVCTLAARFRVILNNVLLVKLCKKCWSSRGHIQSSDGVAISIEDIPRPGPVTCDAHGCRNTAAWRLKVGDHEIVLCSFHLSMDRPLLLCRRRTFYIVKDK